MQESIARFKAHVRKAAANPQFLHHPWFVKWHLELVERIALELAAHYPQADRDMVEALVWLHDYGKIIDRDHERETTLTAGADKLRECEFDENTVTRLLDWMRIFDNHKTADISKAPIEVQIVSSADGCSHLIGPFMQVFWQEFADRPFEQLMEGNLNKAKQDWQHKVVLPEARKAFEPRYQAVLEQNGELPDHLLEV